MNTPQLIQQNQWKKLHQPRSRSTDKPILPFTKITSVPGVKIRPGARTPPYRITAELHEDSLRNLPRELMTRNIPKVKRGTKCYNMIDLDYQLIKSDEEVCIEGTLFDKQSFESMLLSNDRIYINCNPPACRISLITGDYYVPLDQVSFIRDHWLYFVGYNLKLEPTIKTFCNNYKLYVIYYKQGPIPAPKSLPLNIEQMKKIILKRARAIYD